MNKKMIKIFPLIFFVKTKLNHNSKFKPIKIINKIKRPIEKKVKK